MITHPLYKTSYYSDDYNNMAKDLYSDKGYVVIKRFIDKEMINHLQGIFNSCDFNEQLEAINNIKKIQKGNFFHYLAKYFYKDQPSSDDKLNKLIKQIFDERSKITLQPNSDFFMLDYCKRNKLNIENLNDIYNHIYSHSFTRLVKYQNGQGQDWHYDNPGEIQSILYLTQKGIDYSSGGLILENDDGSIVDVDSIVEPGDLVLLNSYKKKHKVNPIECKSNNGIGGGRMYLFVPMIPEYLFPKSYCLNANKYKLFFQNSVSTPEKIYFYMKHYYNLIRKGKINILDKGIQHFHLVDKNEKIGDYSLLNQLKSKKIYLAPLNNLTKTIFYNNIDFGFAGFIDNYTTSLRFENIKFSSDLKYDYVIVATINKSVIEQFNKNKILIMKDNKLQFYINKKNNYE